ncbi:hypothetical protein ACWDG1_41355 [Streptomyces sp. NPDC001177]
MTWSLSRARAVQRVPDIGVIGGTLVIETGIIVELSIVLSDVGVTSTAEISGISALMSLAAAVGCWVAGRLPRPSLRILVRFPCARSGTGLGLTALTTSVRSLRPVP